MKTLLLAIACTLFVTNLRADLATGPIINPANGHAYYLLKPILWSIQGFNASEAEAVSLGGHLVTINNAAENDWVYNTFAPFIDGGVGLLGIGLNDINQEGWYQWTSGEAYTYAKWDPNSNGPYGPQPDGPMDDVVAITVGIFTPNTWHDFNTDVDDVADAWVHAVVEVNAVPEPASCLLLSSATLVPVASKLRKRLTKR